ncbi:MAG: hypothetical protein J0H49_30880 [Acidobacteria bacterium]|nr:hypothetical protein [Acidobacteriota bacterium]
MELPRDEREELEKSWRARLQEASLRYQAATHQCRRILEEQSGEEALPPESSDALVQALQAQSEARIEYGRVLRTLTDLTMYDKLPEGRSGTNPSQRLDIE